jgi:hypothetical protein
MARLFSKEAKARRYGFASAEDLAAAKARLKAMNDAFKPGGLLDRGGPDALKASFGLDGPYPPITRWRGIAGRGGFGGGCSVDRGNWVGGVDGGKGMGLGNRGGSIGGSMSRSMSGRVQRGPGSMVEGMTMGSVGGRTMVVPETMAGERSMLRPNVGVADEFGGTGGFKPRGLGRLGGPDMGMYSESMTQNMGSGVSRLGGERLPRWGGGGL